MTVFVDTSALLAVLNREDLWAVRAGREWRRLVTAEETLATTSYVVLETTAVLQRRIGLEAVHRFAADVLPLLAVTDVDTELQRMAMSNLLVANRRDLSLVDCCSFEYMRRQGLRTAFAFDPHFTEQGFALCGGGVSSPVGG